MARTATRKTARRTAKKAARKVARKAARKAAGSGAKRPAQGRERRMTFTGGHSHPEDHICACDVDFKATGSTSDEQLPAARGGVEGSA